MKTFTVLYIWFLFITVYALFDLDELNSFNYGIDIRNEPIVMKSEVDDEADVNTVHLTSKYGQPYQCSFPNTVEHEKQKEEAEKVAMETGIPDLLKPMESAPCLRLVKDWWSYEFCYGKHIKQFHISDDGKIEGEIMLLGFFESEYNWESDSDQTDGEKKQKRVRRYHTQQYVNGSVCELSEQQRGTEVRFVCEEGSADYISRLDEPETCVYIMTIHTMKICHHPFLKPPTPTKTVTITCNPLLTLIQYQEYLDDLEAKDERVRLEEEKRQTKEEEQRRLKEEKAKYYKENQLDIDEEGGEVEDEYDELTSPTDFIKDKQDSLFSDDWSSVLKNAGGEGSPIQMKTMYKVVESPEDLKDFLKDTIKEMKKLQGDKDALTDEESEEDEDDENEETNVDVPKISTHQHKPTAFQTLDLEDDIDELDDPELEELDTEIKTLKDRYKTRRDRLTDIKRRVKTSMEAQYASIVKEAKEELAQEEGLETGDQIKESQEAIVKLTKTIDSLLNKLDKTEKEIEAVDKELEQFAEYDSEEKVVKSIPPVRDIETHTSAQGPTKANVDNNRVRVRVSRVRRAQKNSLTEDLQDKQTARLEQSVQNELEKAGMGNGEKIQVKIITTGYIDGDDDSMHVLSEQESETFRNMIVDMIGGRSEVDKEQAKHDELEENYSFVWSKSKLTGEQAAGLIEDTTDTAIQLESTTDTEYTTNRKMGHSFITSDKQTKKDGEESFNKETEDS